VPIPADFFQIIKLTEPGLKVGELAVRPSTSDPEFVTVMMFVNQDKHVLPTDNIQKGDIVRIHDCIVRTKRWTSCIIVCARPESVCMGPLTVSLVHCVIGLSNHRWGFGRRVVNSHTTKTQGTLLFFPGDSFIRQILRYVRV
jgi:hypothetical protein